jgi:hypothetical protein
VTTMTEETETIEDKHVLVALDHTGDTRVLWDPTNADEISAAKAMFDSLKKKGYLAYSVKKNGEQGEVVRSFDATEGKIIMTPQLVGG